MAAGPAQALELGELTVHSSIGQPLRASIAYALQPDEQLHAYCVSLKPGITSGGLPALSRAQISIADNVIRVSGQLPVLEPMLGLQLLVDCPYTASLQRDYAMFFDFKAATPDIRQAGSAPTESLREVAATDVARTQAARQPAKAASGTSATSPVPTASRYQVQPGDSLSTIVARIEDRPAGLWPAVEVIFAANPHAFIDGDMNLIKAGSWLDIPDLRAAPGDQAPVANAVAVRQTNRSAATVSESVPAPVQDASASAYEPFDSGYSGVAATVERQGASKNTALVQAPPAPAGDTTSTRANELRPGDVILEGDDPFLMPVDESATSSPDTAISATTAANPVQPVIETRSATSGSWSWLAWLGGAGIAIFLGLLLFGRSLRQKFGSTPIGDALAAEQGRRRSDRSRRPDRAADVDYEFDDAVGDSPSISLDADLGLGTGFRDNADIDVNQDFGFSASEDYAGDFDFEIPAGAGEEREERTTDIIPPNRRIDDAVCIVESEVPPSDEEDDEYDLSMIVDATRQPVVDTHLTAKDLKAVPVGAVDDELDSEEYTLSRDVDYKILEQDYQEEFTTTQALNAEIAKAAMELAESMDRKSSSDVTAELPATVDADSTAEITSSLPAQPESDLTAELTTRLIGHGKAVNDEQISDLDDTGINEELTAELPHADDDVTVEMDVEGGRIDTKKKSRAS